MAVTIQTGANTFNYKGITKYNLMMGGLNVRHDVLKAFDPLVGGYYRIFMVREPAWVKKYLGSTKSAGFRHIVEYGNLGVSGIDDVGVEFDTITGGYSGRSYDIPKVVTDGTNSFQIKLVEFSGCPIREYIHTWVNGTVDTNTNLAHYYGLIASGEMSYAQANHTAEFIYVVTDQTGMKVNYACMFANCFPKKIPTSHFNAEAGQHELAQIDLEFTCTKYEGPEVNSKARELLLKHQIMVNSMEFYSGISKSMADKDPKYYNATTGLLKGGSKDKSKTTNGAGFAWKVNAFSTEKDPTLHKGYSDKKGRVYTTPSYSYAAGGKPL